MRLFDSRTILCAIALALPANALLAGPRSNARAAAFQLETVSISPGQSWQLNRPIGMLFNQAIDFSTVNANTIQITAVSGEPAVGEFYLRSSRHLVFQPACPTEEDFSDAGLRRAEDYVLYVPDASSGGPTVLSVSGAQLTLGAQVPFQTPDSNDPAVLFHDEAPGPPRILVQPGDLAGSWLSAGDGTEAYFQLGANGLAKLPGYRLPLNLYADPTSRVVVNVRMNQALLPVPSNINNSRVRLEYRDLSGAWHPLVTEVRLVQNCTSNGATLELVPRGVLPERRMLRVLVSPELQDIVGEVNATAQDFLQMVTSTFVDGNGQPREQADEWLESFSFGGDGTGSLEDTEVLDPLPRARWGDGALQATTGLAETGGLNAGLDFNVPGGVDLVIDTVSTVILVTDGTSLLPYEVVDGVVDVRNMFVPADSRVVFQGPNPATIFASGKVVIEGQILVDGTDANPVFTLDTPSIPEPGAPGQAGGGDGGTGSYNTTAVTPQGGAGFGAFQSIDEGGEGGESGWNPSSANSGENRRAGGGGGGRFGHDQLTATGCQDQTIYGLDAESGFVGADLAISAIVPFRIPYGGHIGPSPFGTTPALKDDFHGLALLDFEGASPTLIQGELPTAWAGSGGGAGGDATRADAYPPPTLIPTYNDKGAGGGGGAGSISVHALGDIVFGPAGRISAIGGHGSGGENTAWLNRVGGGSGGGSGGHVILHTAGTLDLSQVPSGFQAIDARGGQGGVGAGNLGGADIQELVNVLQDAKHVGYPTPVFLPPSQRDNPWIPTLTDTCYAEAQGSMARWIVRVAGGDGGPGVVQLHVANLAGAAPEHNIAYPGGGAEAELAGGIRPWPVGYDGNAGEWKDHLLPAVGQRSRGQSKWVALGEPQASPTSAAPDPVSFLFDGTDPMTGLVRTTGNTVDSLPPILAPATPIEAPGLPSLVGTHTVHLDAAELDPLDRIYAVTPTLVNGFRLTVAGFVYTVASAELLEQGGTEILAITAEQTSPPVNPTGLVQLIPRSFAVGRPLMDEDYLPRGMSVGIEFQAAAADGHGAPDPNRIYPGAEQWETNISAFDNHAENADFRFLRFRVTFDVRSPKTNFLPSLDFLRLPYRF